MAPPERPARSHVASVLPPPPTISSSRTRIEREPPIISAKASPGDDQDGSTSPSHVASVLPRIEHEPQIISAKASPRDDQDGSTSPSHAAIDLQVPLPPSLSSRELEPQVSSAAKEYPSVDQGSSILPPPPTISSTRTRIEREPEKTSVKASPGDNQDSSSSDETSDSSVERTDRHKNKSGSEYNTTSNGDTGGNSDTSGMLGSIEPPVRIGPPRRVGLPKSKTQQQGTTVDISDEVVVPDGDVTMHSPPHVIHSRRGRARNVKAIGSFSRSQPAKSSGASKSYGGDIGGRALGNVPNIGDFDSTDVNSQSVDVEGTVNIFPSDIRPTTMDIDETAVIAVIVPFEESLAHLLQHVAKYYSPLSDRNACVYILDSKKQRWIVKGRFRDAVEFEESVFQYWDQTDFGLTLTIFLENDLEIASAIPPSFHTQRSSSLLKSRSTSRSSSAPKKDPGSIARPSPASAFPKGPSTLTDLHKEALLTFLEISPELPNLSDSLRNSYKKYQACVRSSKLIKGLRSSNSWTDHLEEFGLEPWVPIYIDLIGIFISKTQFYSTWQGPFKNVQKYGKMVEWLENKEDSHSDSEIWAEKKHPDDYSLSRFDKVDEQERCGEGEKANGH